MFAQAKVCKYNRHGPVARVVVVVVVVVVVEVREERERERERERVAVLKGVSERERRRRYTHMRHCITRHTLTCFRCTPTSPGMKE